MGEEYARKALLDYVGSRQRQSGIIWGKKRDDTLICTSGGRHGERVGYQDCPGDSGIWLYFGQGERGDQDPKRYSNRLLTEGKRTVLLFTTRELTAREIRTRAGSSGKYSKMYHYRGAFRVEAGETFTPSQGRRSGDRLLRFMLVPDVEHELTSPGTPPKTSTSDEASWLAIRRDLVLAAAEATKGRLSEHEYWLRNRQLRAYVRERAGGTCESCGRKAPFVDRSNRPFLEVHHILQLAHDGLNSPRNVIGVCPNCHRRAHFGLDMDRFQQDLKALVCQIEESLDHRQGRTCARV